MSVRGKAQVPWPEGLDTEEPHVNRAMLTGGSGDVMAVSYSLFFLSVTENDLFNLRSVNLNWLIKISF